MMNQYLWKQGPDHTMVKTWLDLRGSEGAEGHMQDRTWDPACLVPIES